MTTEISNIDDILTQAGNSNTAQASLVEDSQEEDISTEGIGRQEFKSPPEPESNTHPDEENNESQEIETADSNDAATDEYGNETSG